MKSDLIKYLEDKSSVMNFSFGVQSIREIKEKNNLSIYQEQLTDKEYKIFNSFKIRKRKVDWLAGRLASKQALKKYLNIDNIPGISILNAEDKSPYFLEFEELTLTISHSAKFAIALVSKEKIGVDIENVINHNYNIINYFFSKAEANYLDSLKSAKQLNEVITKFWTRKEAVSKYLKLGMKINFKTLDTLHNKIKYEQFNNIKISSEKFDDLFLSIAY